MSREAIFNHDGTIKGVGYRRATARRGAVLTIKLGVHDTPGFVGTMFVIDGRDFREMFAKVVDVVADYHQLKKGSKLRLEIANSSDAHLQKFGLKLVQVRYEIAVPNDTLGATKEVSISGMRQIT